MAVAAKQARLDRRVVAIIGDGAMTAGQAFEALNNAGTMDANLLVILNDNDMSISPNVGALNHYLTKLMSGRFLCQDEKRLEKRARHCSAVAEISCAGRRTRQGHDHTINVV